MRRLRLSEILVLVALGGILIALILSRAAKARSQGYQAACLSNLHMWGLAIAMYADDNNRTYYYSAAGVGWDDDGSPYFHYLGKKNARLHKLRICPARAAAMAKRHIPESEIHDYSMSLPDYAEDGRVYLPIGARGRFTDDFGNVWPTLMFVRKPAEYLLLIDSSGHTLTCGGLEDAVNGVPANDTVRAIDRHQGSVNCLFGDFHAEAVSYREISKQDDSACHEGNPWFMMN
jgi:prepilin-type processing-associated H-X9-DG protein